MKVYAKSLLTIHNKEQRKWRRHKIAFSVITFFIVYRMVFSIILMSTNIAITAHRGSTNIAPENTIASVVEAIALDVDYIEVDVQLSKDGQVFLLHDSTFKRTAGVYARPWNLTYEEILLLNVGAYKTDSIVFSAPLLDDVVKLCALSNVKLNIELKDYGHSQDLPTEVIRVIRENDFMDRCVITSTSQTLLKKVREMQPNLKIGLITSSTSITAYMKCHFVDFYSVNYLSLSPSIVLYVHSRHKEIHSWTPSNRLAIETAIHEGADNIITNNVSLTKLLIISNH